MTTPRTEMMAIHKDEKLVRLETELSIICTLDIQFMMKI